jgi:hypothetical protein
MTKALAEKTEIAMAFSRRKTEKGKPVEKQGRKAYGSKVSDRITRMAELPGIRWYFGRNIK